MSDRSTLTLYCPTARLDEFERWAEEDLGFAEEESRLVASWPAIYGPRSEASRHTEWAELVFHQIPLGWADRLASPPPIPFCGKQDGAYEYGAEAFLFLPQWGGEAVIQPADPQGYPVARITLAGVRGHEEWLRSLRECMDEGMMAEAYATAPAPPITSTRGEIFGGIPIFRL